MAAETDSARPANAPNLTSFVSCGAVGGGLGDDRVGVLNSGEGPAAVVLGGDEALDGGDGVGDGREIAAAQRLPGDLDQG